jgi:hypothetical protein
MNLEMDELKRQPDSTAEEIERLKEDIFKQKEAISGINELVKTQIDRDFHTDLWELSYRELDNEMGNRLGFLNDDIDTRPDFGSISSHRKFIGKPIVFIKRFFMKITRFYTDTLFDKQRSFNGQVVAFHLASFIRFRHMDEQIKGIEKKLKTLEEDNELMLEQLEQLKNE